MLILGEKRMHDPQIEELSRAVRNIAAKAKRDDTDVWLPLWIHAADTAEIMCSLIKYWLPQASVRAIGLEERQLLSLARFLGLVHDLGKITPVFQRRIAESLPSQISRLERAGLSIPVAGRMDPAKTPHALAGEVVLLNNSCPAGIAAVVGAHHGKPQGFELDPETQITAFFTNYNGTSRGGDWERIRNEWLSFSLKSCGYNDVQLLPELSMKSQVLLTGLLIMADWIASNTHYFPLIPIDSESELTVYPDRAIAGWDRLSLPHPWAPTCAGMSDELFNNRFGFFPNEIQRAIIETAKNVVKPGIFILEAQMGVGKTEAALAAAEILASQTGSGGLFFGLPTQATANGIFKRLETWAERQSEDTVHAIRLAHGMAVMNEDYNMLFETSSTVDADSQYGGLIAHAWFGGRKQALLADFVIGTVDQLLLAALKQKHVMLRHLGLAGKVVIVDECHAYDAYMNQYLDMALSWLGAYGVPVILLSATLPPGRRAELVAAYMNKRALPADLCVNCGYPLLTWMDGADVYQSTIECHDTPRKVSIDRLTDDAIPCFLDEMLSGGGCAGVIVNTVSRAQTIAGMLRDHIKDTEVMLCHAQFLIQDRAVWERSLLDRLGRGEDVTRPERFIVVGTQVLEQSLDIDFDILVTDLCPMDLLLQRVGRLHRHLRQRPDKLSEAKCLVLGAGDEGFEAGARAIYGDWLLLRTRALLPDTVTIPNDIPQLVQETYYEGKRIWEETDTYIKAKEQFDNARKKQISRAKEYCVSKPEEDKNFASLNLISGWLDTDIGKGDHHAEAAVRDGEPSVEVLLLMRDCDGRIRFLPWQYGGEEVPSDHVPDREVCRRIARQRIRLPGIFCRFGNLERTIEELENTYRSVFIEWGLSTWLGEELILLLDENLSAMLCGRKLTYSRVSGLIVEKEESDGNN